MSAKLDEMQNKLAIRICRICNIDIECADILAGSIRLMIDYAVLEVQRDRLSEDVLKAMARASGSAGVAPNE